VEDFFFQVDIHMGAIVIYTSQVSGNLKTKKDSTRISDILTIKKIPFEIIDVSVDA
jgi:hypothetical protein